MAGSLGELFVELGVKGDPKKIDAFVKKAQELAKQYGVTETTQKRVNEDFSKMARKLRNVSLAITATIYAVEKMTDALVKDNQAWMQFEQQTDLSLKTLQGYAGVASLFDKSLGMQGAAGSIQALQDKLFELQLTGEGARGFQIAGINPVGQNAFGVLEQVRERIKGLNDTSATYLLRQLGLDPKMLPMLRMERSEFEELRKVQERLTLTEEERAQIRQLSMRREVAHQKLRLAQQRLMLALLPLWTKLTELVGAIAEGVGKLTHAFNKLNPAFKGIIVSTAAWFAGSKLLNALLTNKTIKLFARLLGLSGKLKLNLTAIGKNIIPMVGMALKGLLRTVTTLIAPLLSLYLILEDIAVWLAGGESVIGSYVDVYKNWREGREKIAIENLNLDNLEQADPTTEAGKRAKELLKIKQETLDKYQNSWWGRAIERVRPGTAQEAANKAITDRLEQYERERMLQPSIAPMTSNVQNTTNSPTVHQVNYFAPGTATDEADARLQYAQAAVSDVR